MQVCAAIPGVNAVSGVREVACHEGDGDAWAGERHAVAESLALAEAPARSVVASDPVHVLVIVVLDVNPLIVPVL